MKRVNLIPHSQLRARAARFRARRWFAIGLCCCPLTIAAYLYDSFEQARATDAQSEMNRVTSAIATTRVELQQLRTARAAAELERARSEQLRRKRYWSQLLVMVAQAMPKDLRLTSVRTDPAVPTPAGTRRARVPQRADETKEGDEVLIEAPRGLVLSGMASSSGSPLTYVVDLQKLGVFEEVLLDNVRRAGTSDIGTFGFEVRLTW